MGFPSSANNDDILLFDTFYPFMNLMHPLVLSCSVHGWAHAYQQATYIRSDNGRGGEEGGNAGAELIASIPTTEWCQCSVLR